MDQGPPDFSGITKGSIDVLEELQSPKNQGRGINCVESIIFYLRRDDYRSALAVRQHDGDKTASYPDVEKQLVSMFGCRLHNRHNCTSWLCQKIQERNK